MYKYIHTYVGIDVDSNNYFHIMDLFMQKAHKKLIRNIKCSAHGNNILLYINRFCLTYQQKECISSYFF